MLRKLLAGVCLGALFGVALLGQESRGAITGRITDPQGGVIPNAKVAVTNTLTNEVRRVTTN